MYDVEQELRSALHAAAPEGRSVPFDPIARRARTRRNLRAATASAASALAVAAVAVTASSFGPGLTNGPSTAGSPTPGATTQPTSQSTTQSTAQVDGSCVRGLDPARIAVDYVDFVRMYGHEYLAVSDPRQVVKTGRTIGTVRCTFSVTLPGPDHLPQDGDAAFLPVGTELYELAGWSPTIRLVAKAPGRGWVIYEVSDPQLRKAAGLG